MWNLNKYLTRKQSLFTPLETRLIAEVQSRLEPTMRELLAQQIASVNLIQRHSDDREVNCYSVRSGKVYHNPSIQFPTQERELKFATIKFTLSQPKKFWVATFILIDGYFFSIEFNTSPRRIQTNDEIVVNSTDIYFNQVQSEVRQEMVNENFLSFENFHGWLKDFMNKHLVTEFVPPLDEGERQKMLRKIDAALPEDYIDMIAQCDGFATEQCQVYGVSDAYEVIFSTDSYYVLAEFLGKGVLAVKSHTQNELVYYLQYESDNVEIESSFHEALNEFLDAN